MGSSGPREKRWSGKLSEMTNGGEGGLSVPSKETEGVETLRQGGGSADSRTQRKPTRPEGGERAGLSRAPRQKPLQKLP